MLSRDGRPTPLRDAIAHYGRIAKTLHILRLADEPGYRRQIKVQANLQERSGTRAWPASRRLYAITSTCSAGTPSSSRTCLAAYGPCAIRIPPTRSEALVLAGT